MPAACRTYSVSYHQFAFSVLEIKQKALHWAQQFRKVNYYEGNNVSYPNGTFRTLLGVSDNVEAENIADPFIYLNSRLAKLQHAEMPQLGYFTYDLKNHIEKLSSSLPDRLQWPKISLFQPNILVEWLPDRVKISSTTLHPEEVWQQILATSVPMPQKMASAAWQQRVTKSEYLRDVQAIRKHIEEGDVYELNYCQEFYAQCPGFRPLQVFWRLMELSPMPFCGFLKLDDLYLLCDSPERFLKKEGSRVLSQPIKGTAKRGKTEQEDEAAKQHLRGSEKERAENMMIVDLVRNDLSRCCEIGSVRVNELFGIYSFPFVHQMISTISGNLKPEKSFTDLLRATFPMGSMTGAPKVRAMQLIEQYEKVKRGLFSGSIGYIFPDGSADFNVVIRSLQFNSQTGYLSYEVGGAITYDSVPEEEYEECLLKAAALRRVLEN